MGVRITHNVNFRKDILRSVTYTGAGSLYDAAITTVVKNMQWARKLARELGENRIRYLKESLWGGEDVPEPGEGYPPQGDYPGIKPGRESLSEAYSNKRNLSFDKVGKYHIAVNIGNPEYLDEATRFGGKSELANLGIWRFFEYGRRVFRSGGKGGTEWYFIYSPGKGKFGQGYLIQRTEKPSGKEGSRKQVPANQAAVVRKPVLWTIYFKLNWRLRKQIEEGLKKVTLGRPGYAFKGKFEPGPGIFFGGVGEPGE